MSDGNGVCKCRTNGQVHFDGSCRSDPNPDIGYYYSNDYQTYINCGVGCATCDKNHCLSCSNGYVLVVSSGGSTCRRNSDLFVCSEEYYEYDEEKKICSPKNEAKDSCLVAENNTCVICKNQYFLGI